MACERRTSGIWVVNIDPQMPDRDVRGYNSFVDRLREFPMGSRYKAISLKPFACFEAVEIWKKLEGLFPNYQLVDQWFLFNQKVKDHFGFEETGQNMLKARLSQSDNLLVVDVAGYLFGFPYEQMLIAAGSLDYLAKKVTEHYSQRYPNLVCRPG